MIEYLCHIAVLVCIFGILSVSLDLLAGHTGLLSIAHAVFFGFGAYTTALIALHFAVPWPLCLLAGMFVGACLSVIVSYPSLRLRGDYFVVGTFAFQIIVFHVFTNWKELTRGPLGLPGIPAPTLFGVQLATPIKFVFFAACFLVLTHLIVWQTTHSPFGRVLRGIRENELFSQCMGKNTLYFKVIAFALSAALAASAGSLYAYYMTFIDPTSFTFSDSVLVISMVIVGGAGSRWGPLLGAAIIVVIPESLRFLGLPSSSAAHLRQIFYGALLVGMMMIRPQGILGRYDFGRD